MDDSFLIWIDRLKGTQTQKIGEILPPSFLDVKEPELLFESPVVIKGEAYIAENELIINLKITAVAKMPCAICNQMTDVPIVLENFYHTESLENIPSAVFDFREALREAILIEVPKYAECKEKCPERGSITPYLRAATKTEKTTYLPFKDLD